MILSRTPKNDGRGIAAAFLLGACVIATAQAGDLSNYRGFHFGMSLSAAAKVTGAQPAEAKTIHQRPALMQELEWFPRSTSMTEPLATNPVKDGTLYFYNGELFRIAVTYDRYRIEGMTADDLIAAISATYGPATKPAAEIAYHSYYGETAAVLARWEDADCSYNLIRTGDRSSFALVLYSKRLEALAQAANVEAARLDALDAPQRELEKQKKQASDDSVLLEKARSANKPNFRP